MIAPDRLVRWCRRRLRASGGAGRGARTIGVLAVVALVSLGVGIWVSHLVVSPAQAAADAAPPAAGPVTVPVERRVITNQVVLRGDAVYDDPVDVRVETGEVDGPAVVTGRVPAVGDTFEAGGVALEVVGRPVLVLPGALPTYRTLRAGVSGPDVAQLKAALAQLGISSGPPSSTTYDASTAAAVEELYRRVGYEPPQPSDEADDQLKAATAAVRDTTDALGQAQRALTAASGGQRASEIIELDTAVAVARQELTDATQACASPAPAPTDTGGRGTECSASALLSAQGALDAAVARRTEADAGPDLSDQKAAVTSAERALSDAKADLADAQAAVLTALPASEIVFLPSLPRRVDTVDVKVGGILDGKALTVSGASLAVVASADPRDADLLTVGGPAVITLDGSDIAATVTDVVAKVAVPTATSTKEATGDQQPTTDREDPGASTASSGGGHGYVVRLAPVAPTADQLAALRGANVRVTVPVGSSDGEVLAVPLSALTSGPGGESRVELMRADGSTHLVTVQLGLAADGYAEITRSQEALDAGDLVVVGEGPAGGRSGSAKEPTG
ncbi:hypothetical protein [Cellulomonas sp. URHB0016]